jgi:hypothetical protein
MILERLTRSSGFRWLEKGFWALSDQALFALSNFGLNVIACALVESA